MGYNLKNLTEELKAKGLADDCISSRGKFFNG